MGLYSVLLVDDEAEVIEIIQRKTPWEEMGFRVCGHAANGIEALEMAEDLQPDVVMTDIKMPYMDGLELAKHLKNRLMDIRIILFSGFDDFDYARQAIGLEVEEYLLKPVDPEAIRDVFTKMRHSLDAERDQRNNIAHLENYYEKSLPLLRESFLSSLMEEKLPESAIEADLAEYQMEMKGPLYVISLIHTSSHQAPEGMSPRLLRLQVRQLLDSSPLNEKGSYIFNYRNNIVVLSQFAERDAVSRYTDLCDRFCRAAKRVCGAVVTVGIGEVVQSISEIPNSYSGASEALGYRTLYGAGSAINIKEIKPRTANVDAVLLEDRHFHDVLRQIKLGDAEELTRAVDRYIDHLWNAKPDLPGFRLALMEMLTELYRFLSNNDISPDVIHEHNEDVYLKLMQMGSPGELRVWLLSAAGRIQGNMQQLRVSNTGAFVRKARAYVEEHYSNPDLSTDLVCQELGLSSAYFSAIFKKETGKTFINYLTEYRMKEAERLLLEKDEKKYIIAEKVGYADPSYFSYVFKKWFGMSPMKYKNTHSS